MEIFFIPNTRDKDNKITEEDIKNRKLRITCENKKYFPDSDCEIIIVINDKKYSCILKSDDKERSFRIHLSKEAMDNLKLKTSDILECQRVSDKKYIFSK